MKPVQCPSCSLRWNIPEHAHPVITCPRCLAPLINPYASDEPTGAKPPALPVRPVLPLENQIARDKATSNIGLIIVLIVISLGIVLMFVSIGRGASISVEGIIGLFVIAAAAAIPLVVVARKKPAQVSGLAPAAAVRTHGAIEPGGVLNYQAPTKDPRTPRPGAIFAQAIGGIILGIVGCLLVTGALAQVANGAFAMLGIGAPVIAGIFLCTMPRVRGLGIGLILALPVAFLLLLGFCAIIIGSGGFH
jgi:hypothetical protein